MVSYISSCEELELAHLNTRKETGDKLSGQKAFLDIKTILTSH